MGRHPKGERGVKMGIEPEIILSGLIKNPDAIVDIVSVITPSDFSDPKHRRCYEAILALWEQKLPVDIATVTKQIGQPYSDAVWVAGLTDTLPANLDWAVAELAEQSKQRRITDRLKNIYGESSTMLDGIINIYQDELAYHKKPADIKTHIKTFRQAQKANAEKDGFGIPTGFECLENNYIQYCPGHVWTIGAYTSVGKTATAVEMVCRAIDQKILIISTEMTVEQNIARILANQTGTNGNVILSGRLFDMQQSLVDDYIERLEARNLTIYDDVFELPEIEAAVRKADLQGGVDIVFIDYLQNISVPGAKSEYEAMNKVAKTIQRLAKQVNATIVCLSQIPNHAAREDTGIIEFKGAGEIAAVSDVGIWLKRDKDDKGKILFDVRKNRHGALTKVVLAYDNGWTSLIETGEEVE